MTLGDIDPLCFYQSSVCFYRPINTATWSFRICFVRPQYKFQALIDS